MSLSSEDKTGLKIQIGEPSALICELKLQELMKCQKNYKRGKEGSGQCRNQGKQNGQRFRDSYYIEKPSSKNGEEQLVFKIYWITTRFLSSVYLLYLFIIYYISSTFQNYKMQPLNIFYLSSAAHLLNIFCLSHFNERVYTQTLSSKIFSLCPQKMLYQHRNSEIILHT